MVRRCLACYLILLLAASGMACSEAQMAAPVELSTAVQPWKVEQTRATGWDAPFSFGPYTVRDIKRGWTKSTAWGFIAYESYRADQSYEYMLTTGQGNKAWHCNCAANVNQQVLESMVGGGKLSWEVSARRSLACSLRSPKGILWRLALASGGASNAPMKGVLEGPTLTMQIRGTNKLAGTTIPLSEPTGYVFSINGPVSGTAGAVQVINNGILWLPDSPQQGAMAAVSAAMLLYQDVSRK
ncbi:MAG: hypothetical protein K9K65_08980 [Desulfarculaceae bacterium]|nr:hypothetical protein [Desulfarculaceae bacterium]MCF8046159.1 hypothetical protein [Desulfarculaceae bacterium]MCF8065825.1 hypothetical protein [Desulfarculaceae bacterium]MCF8097961.1 hypothetical protein [Desulfarculaceae bacterium]MCF8123992.1 hypothetical protein [Desulfarculaceae bacterium]